MGFPVSWTASFRVQPRVSSIAPDRSDPHPSTRSRTDRSSTSPHHEQAPIRPRCVGERRVLHSACAASGVLGEPGEARRGPTWRASHGRAGVDAAGQVKDEETIRTAARPGSASSSARAGCASRVRWVSCVAHALSPAAYGSAGSPRRLPSCRDEALRRGGSVRTMSSGPRCGVHRPVRATPAERRRWRCRPRRAVVPRTLPPRAALAG